MSSGTYSMTLDDQTHDIEFLQKSSHYRMAISESDEKVLYPEELVVCLLVQII